MFNSHDGEFFGLARINCNLIQNNQKEGGVPSKVKWKDIHEKFYSNMCSSVAQSYKCLKTMAKTKSQFGVFNTT